jgi:hypothetical protein
MKRSDPVRKRTDEAYSGQIPHCRQLLPWDYFRVARHPGTISTVPLICLQVTLPAKYAESDYTTHMLDSVPVNLAVPSELAEAEQSS